MKHSFQEMSKYCKTIFAMITNNNNNNSIAKSKHMVRNLLQIDGKTVCGCLYCFLYLLPVMENLGKILRYKKLMELHGKENA